MMRSSHRWFWVGVVLVAFAMLAAACSSTEDTTTTAEATSSTEIGLPSSEIGLVDVHACSEFGLTDRFMFSAPPGSSVREGLATRVSPDDDGRYGEAFNEDLRADLASVQEYYVVADQTLLDMPSPALEAVNVLRLDDVDARPVYGMALQRHWTLEPGGEPARTIEGEFAAAASLNDSDGDPIVGVIDAGWLVKPTDLAATGVTDERHAPFIDLTATGQKSPGDDFHGSFVASLISRIAPRAALRLQAVQPVVSVPAQNWMIDGTPKEVFVTDSAAVAAAIIQLNGLDQIDSFTVQYENPVEILNLSLGTYACPTPDAPDGVLPPGDVEVLIELMGKPDPLDTNEPLVDVVAAGGNEANVLEELMLLDPEQAGASLTTAFYPAAFDDAIGVGALSDDERGELPVTWDESGMRVFGEGVSWNEMAPGVDVIALFLSEDEAIVWSGSSFATAIYTGLLANPQRDVTNTFGEIPGLCWIVHGGLNDLAEKGDWVIGDCL